MSLAEKNQYITSIQQALFFGIKRAGSYAPIDTRCTRPSKGLAKNETTKNSRKGMILNNDFSVNEI